MRLPFVSDAFSSRCGYDPTVQQAVPTIYAPPANPMRISLYARAIALVIAVGCAAVILIAMRLHPAHDGSGTHQELGLLPCSMLMTTGIPCPSCGMTTSFAWFFSGNLLAAFYVQPAGFVAAYFTGAIMLLAGYESITARPIHRLARFLSLRFWIITGLAIFLAGWAWKIVIHLAGVDGW